MCIAETNNAIVLLDVGQMATYTATKVFVGHYSLDERIPPNKEVTSRISVKRDLRHTASSKNVIHRSFDRVFDNIFQFVEMIILETRNRSVAHNLKHKSSKK